MAGERDLDRLLAGLDPRLRPGVFCFVTAADGVPHPDAVATVREDEGLSLLLPVERARAAGLAFEGRFRWITLGVHSALDAVGLTAAVASRLAAAGIPANVIAGRFHDHVLVPEDHAEEAVTLLRAAG